MTIAFLAHKTPSMECYCHWGTIKLEGNTTTESQQCSRCTAQTQLK